ncbi:hypothetical protein HXA31_20265 [Salipaludibacillus agaradhaerens]|uniref:Uncharacterized protein n=1 Tax=Salipaludibacillus agaradhaerens TaxID=76935 RepID=A0A9Q4B2A2_SALAG|nr:hypothetical protein [Salipaludibacillus agaradhaerens]MCR6096896.1 hypothetical protein [Salipaludibacillus agaradhaerens]MCR6116666.1 hypothetical protein [Salipaludibacillus agaradhaerens]
MFSRPSYAKRLGMTDNRVRKCIDLMLKDNMIVKVGSLGRNKPTIYKVTNYDEYNSSPTETVGVEETEGFSTNSKPTENQLKTNSPPLKKIEKKEKIEKKDINNKRSKLKFETIHLKLAELLFKKIKENNPNAKKPNLESWANTFRLMIESDKRDGKEIQDIILWCQSHHFWYQNILSADKLRKQYDRLKLQMLDDGGQKNERNQSSYEQDYSKYDFYKSGEL